MSESASSRREGRGRLSSIDMLPDEAEPDLVWAVEQLRERKMHARAILDEFNARLADRGIGPISKSAWGRYAVRKAIQFRRLDEVRRISDELVESLGADGPDQVTVAVAEMVKLAAFRLLEGGDTGAKDVNELARALNSAVNAQKTSAEHRRRIEQQLKDKLESVADKAETLGREAGLSADRIAQMRRDVLGLRT
jgi:hypothetical protein